jgi:hypothetical protein
MSRRLESGTYVLVWCLAAAVLLTAGGAAVLLAPLAGGCAAVRAHRDGWHLPRLHRAHPGLDARA